MSDHRETHPRAVFGCSECIAIANRGTADIGPDGSLPEGWHYYRVEVSKTYSSWYYVAAASREAAQADADEIELDKTDYSLDDEYAIASKATTPEPGDPLWTGGPDGNWTVVPKVVGAV